MPGLLAAGGLCVVAMNACASTPVATPAATPTAPSTTAASSPWYWLGTVGSNDTSAPDPRRYTLTLTTDRVALQADCNRGSGSYQLEGDRLSIAPVALTRMACASGSQGDLFAQQVQAANSLRNADDVMTLDLAADAGTMFFARDATARLQAWRCREGSIVRTVAVGEALHLWTEGVHRALKQYPTASGARYRDGPMSFDTKGGSATFDIGDQKLRACQVVNIGT